jgi:hypothetical protein
LKKTHHKKRAGGVAQGIDPELKHQYYKKKKKKSSWRLSRSLIEEPHASSILITYRLLRGSNESPFEVPLIGIFLSGLQSPA